ncbi:hypothetical protein BDQ94DRAFT_145022 [Aspergillus welwitschiae]|uniref:Uncharacterized protein n=1 Tax=Aspergillus welwitschiae TaxID=1341132 RepID=A0A3F3Q0U4_9EURO|nr:hypothetical protein BDQ94DRAFT_145022 [Aspergillus welwitschiae]RDH32780.1 hypothetical protein BDQ94DRAFT_145022 [Aspergillus welwitschiae]
MWIMYGESSILFILTGPVLSYHIVSLPPSIHSYTHPNSIAEERKETPNQREIRIYQTPRLVPALPCTAQSANT